MAHYYTADWHIGHANINRMCNRGFTDVDAMDAALVARAAATLTAQDDLWMVGDFSLNQTRARRVFDQIPGRKHLVPGNHDQAPWVRRLGWHAVHDSITELRDQGQLFILCHYPLETWNQARRGSINLFGHIHEKRMGHQRAINVGVDCWDFTPIDKHAILERAESLPWPAHWEQPKPPIRDCAPQQLPTNGTTPHHVRR